VLLASVSIAYLALAAFAKNPCPVSPPRPHVPLNCVLRISAHGLDPQILRHSWPSPPGNRLPPLFVSRLHGLDGLVGGPHFDGNSFSVAPHHIMQPRPKQRVPSLRSVAAASALKPFCIIHAHVEPSLSSSNHRPPEISFISRSIENLTPASGSGRSATATDLRGGPPDRAGRRLGERWRLPVYWSSSRSGWRSLRSSDRHTPSESQPARQPAAESFTFPSRSGIAWIQAYAFLQPVSWA